MVSFNPLSIPPDHPFCQSCITFCLFDALFFQFLVQFPVVELGRSRDVKYLIYGCLAWHAFKNKPHSVYLSCLIELEAPTSEDIAAAMSILMMTNIKGCIHLQSVVPQPSHRGIDTLQAETP